MNSAWRNSLHDGDCFEKLRIHFLLDGSSSFDAQGLYGVDGGRAARRNDAGNGSRNH
jgi:hypothetical protein